MNKAQFVVEPSEVEKMYPDLFAPMNIEGLEAPVATRPKETVTATAPPRDSEKIRKKIEQKKMVASKRRK